ncbi:MAG: hypothetical protein J5955_06480 [Bacilli bacterium]|nr:hypothetical protein [Bacilli bacterium]
MGFETAYKLNKNSLKFMFFVLSICRLFSFWSYRKIRKHNLELSKFKKSKRVVIMGLGPSANDLDFDSIDCDTIVVNRFIRYSLQKGFKRNPTFYCFADDAFYTTEKKFIDESIASFSDTAFLLNGKYIKNVKNYSKRNNVFFGFFQKAFCSPKKALDFCKRIPMNMNVVGFAIELALYLGYEKIEIYGLDFTSALTKKAIHCYSEAHVETSEPFKLTYYYNSIAYEQFDCYKKYSIAHNVKIVNKSKISLVDCFEFED